MTAPRDLWVTEESLVERESPDCLYDIITALIVTMHTCTNSTAATSVNVASTCIEKSIASIVDI